MNGTLYITTESGRLMAFDTGTSQLRGEGRRLMRWLWSRVGAHSRVIPYDKPGLHQMNLYKDRLYVASTVWNEIWIVDFGLHVLERVALQPHRRDFYHLNNVFCDGAAFYVCLNRYDGRHGVGGYAKFDLAWNETSGGPSDGNRTPSPSSTDKPCNCAV